MLNNATGCAWFAHFPIGKVSGAHVILLPEPASLGAVAQDYCDSTKEVSIATTKALLYFFAAICTFMKEWKKLQDKIYGVRPQEKQHGT